MFVQALQLRSPADMNEVAHKTSVATRDDEKGCRRKIQKCAQLERSGWSDASVGGRRKSWIRRLLRPGAAVAAFPAVEAIQVYKTRS